MFSVTKALKKLIECSIGDGKKHCNGYVTFSELNAIFEAGHEDSCLEKVKDKLFALDQYVANEHLIAKKIEERLARLEEDITRVGDRLTDHIYQEKPATEEKYKHQEFKNEPSVGSLDTKPEKTVTDALSIGHLSDIGAFKQNGARLNDDKPSECITPHKCVSDGAVYMSNPPQNRCKICGKFWYV